MKKKAAPKARGGASYDMLVDVYGSDRGGKMKANAAQKKSQEKTAAQRKTSPRKVNSMGDELMSTRQYNSRQGDLAGSANLSGIGRTSTRGYNQTANAFRSLAKKSAAKKLETAKKAKQKGR